MSIRAVYVDFGGVIMRTEDTGPRLRLAERLGMTSRALEKIIFESESSARASKGEILEDAHWDSVAEALGVSRPESDKITAEFFSGDRADTTLLDYLRSLRPERKVGLISNAWSGLRALMVRENLDQVFDEMIISAEVGVVKPDPRIYRLALEKLGMLPEESVFVDDVLQNVEGARAVGMNGIQFTRPDDAMKELKQLLSNHR